MNFMNRRITLPFTILLILLSLTVQGAYAIEQNTTREDMPPMDTADMKERLSEMIDNNIESLDTLQSETDYDELNDSIDGLLVQLQALRSELENAEEEEDMLEIMNEFRTLVEESPEEIREVLMENSMMGGTENADFDPANSTMRGPGGEGASGMNDTMRDESMRDSVFDPENAGKEQNTDTSSADENNGLLSGLINMIKSLFQ